MTPNDSANTGEGAPSRGNAGDGATGARGQNTPLQPVTLAEADQRAVDLLVDHGFDLDAAVRAHPAERDRLEAAHALFMRIDAYPVEAPDPSLVDATLARIDRSEDERSERMTFDPRGNSGLDARGDALPAGPRAVPSLGRGRWADFIAVACVAVLGVSVGLPLLNSMNERSAIAGCASNLRSLGSALATYHGDHNSRPIAAGFAPDLSRLASWTGYDNSKHLDVLHQKGYCGPQCVCCGNDGDRSGYASLVPHDRVDGMWLTHAHLPLVADRNPLVMQSAFGGRILLPAVDNSPDHGRRGQNVLFGDLSVVFEVSPILTIMRGPSGPPTPENIWIPADNGGLEDEFHAPREWSAVDIFLVQ